MNQARTFGLVILLGFVGPSAEAQEIRWRAARPAAERTPSADDRTPPLRLGTPVALQPDAVSDGRTDRMLRRASAWDAPIGGAAAPIVRTQGPGQGVPPVPPPPPPGAAAAPGPSEEGYNCAVPDVAPPTGLQGLITGITQPVGGRRLFESDHCFDQFISPVTNPFYFEDPRSLTELRPVYIYQNVPNENGAPGGQIHSFTLQGRLALTERLSLVMNRMGWIFIDPDNEVAPFTSDDGFSEIHIGPNYTLLRNEGPGPVSLLGPSLFAIGLTFELPVGSSRVFQDTGDLSLTPYFSYGQALLKNPYGEFHFLNTTGYSFAVDDERTSFFFSSFHLDFDIGNWHRIYPFVEVNWFVYTADGDVRDFTFEGRDLINFGSRDVSGHHDLSIAVGARYKFSEHIQLGAAAEFPLLNRQDLMDFRLTFDFILRY